MAGIEPAASSLPRKYSTTELHQRMSLMASQSMTSKNKTAIAPLYFSLSKSTASRYSIVINFDISCNLLLGLEASFLAGKLSMYTATTGIGTRYGTPHGDD